MVTGDWCAILCACDHFLEVTVDSFDLQRIEKETPQKSNELIPKNGHISKESPFEILLGIQPLVLEGCIKDNLPVN